MTPLTLTVTPADAAKAYRGTESGLGASSDGADGSSFGGALRRAIEGVVQTGHEADAQATAAVAGGGDISEVVTAVSRAELALQTTATIRDRMVQAYQDIMRMPI